MKEKMTPEKMIEMFTYEISSKLPINDIHEKVPAACEQNKFALLQTYVYHDIVAGKGFPIDRKVYIYEICQARTAAEMLTDFPHFSLFMPCKLAIYEKNDETVISTMNMRAVLDAVRSNSELFNDATSLFNTLKILMDNISK
ncbi:DUF302 domain-containing protein [Draconibacterium sediminis]|uniref:DUF302 domain-containing protein n=1 Tax=Draconibacterium sediminis TaxID=1544798 RepID=A0A0D8JCS2_9BACT|nr:DUF302 domain-containing protein [Draconibacterium sediminis]KJF43603.1 hypothetical protein LH29_10810 [Draconibacterium sediminis]